MSQIRHQSIAPTHAESQAAGTVIDRHHHDDHQLIYVSTGVVAITTENSTWVASRDRAVWVPAGVWHEHRFYGRSVFHTLGFPVTDTPLPDTAPCVVSVDGLVRELLIACTEPDLPTAEARRLRAVLHDRLPRARVQPLSLPVAQDARLAHACRVVVDDLSVPWPLSALAREVGAGERTLARLFRIEYGVTYPQWRTNVRVFHAMIQLAQGATVTETAHRCGWATTSAFIDTFARSMGQTPGTYRAT